MEKNVSKTCCHGSRLSKVHRTEIETSKQFGNLCMFYVVIKEAPITPPLIAEFLEIAIFTHSSILLHVLGPIESTLSSNSCMILKMFKICKFSTRST